MIQSLLACFLVEGVLFPLLAMASVPAARTEHSEDVSAFLSALKSEDEEEADKAVEAIQALGKSTVPVLVEYVANEFDCRGRVRALFIIYEFDPRNAAGVSAALDVVTKGCALSAREDWMQRLSAGMYLAGSGPGLRILGDLLRHRRTAVRRIAVFVFDERAETMKDVSPAMAEATKEALPNLYQAARDKDQVVREVACEVLEELASASQSDVAAEAGAFLMKLGQAR